MLNFIIKTLNKIAIKRKFGNPAYAHLFDYLNKISVEGKSFGYAGNVSKSGELLVIDHLNRINTHNNQIIFDVGANVGQYQKMLLSSLKNKDFTIFSFEPSPSTYSTLTKLKADTRILNFNVGFGQEDAKIKLYRNQEGSPLASIYKKNPMDYYKVKSMDDYEEIELTSIDDFCAKNNIEKIDYLKMDIEGHEYFALLGAKKLLSESKINMIQFEFGPANIDSKTFFRDFYSLLNQNYIIYRVMKHGLHPISTYSELEEIFLPINYCAVLRSLEQPVTR